MFFSSSAKKEEFHAGFGIDQDEALFTFTGTISRDSLAFCAYNGHKKQPPETRRHGLDSTTSGKLNCFFESSQNCLLNVIGLKAHKNFSDNAVVNEHESESCCVLSVVLAGHRQNIHPFAESKQHWT